MEEKQTGKTSTAAVLEDSGNELRQQEQEMGRRLDRYHQLSDNVKAAVDKREADRKAAEVNREHQRAMFRRMMWVICLILAFVIAVLFYQVQLGILT